MRCKWRFRKILCLTVIIYRPVFLIHLKPSILWFIRKVNWRDCFHLPCSGDDISAYLPNCESKFWLSTWLNWERLRTLGNPTPRYFEGRFHVGQQMRLEELSWPWATPYNMWYSGGITREVAHQAGMLFFLLPGLCAQSCDRRLCLTPCPEPQVQSTMHRTLWKGARVAPCFLALHSGLSSQRTNIWLTHGTSPVCAQTLSS